MCHISDCFVDLAQIPMNVYLYFPKDNWGVSSVGSERLLDRQEVTGSIPVHPTTTKTRFHEKERVFYACQQIS